MLQRIMNGVAITIGWLCSSFVLLQSPFLFAQSRADCLSCHNDQSLSREKDGRQVSLFVDESILSNSPHRKLVCVACHTGFKPDEIPHKEKIEPVNCLTCHRETPFRHTFHPQLAEAMKAHQEPDISCKDCHGTHDVVSPKVKGSKFHAANLTESCGECHADVKEHFLESAHGKALSDGVKGAPNCLTCHRAEVTNVSGLRDTLQVKVAQEKLCLSCHLDDPDVRSRTAPTAGFIAVYEKSVHGAALLKGNPKAANCVDCHGSHEMKKAHDPTSLVNKSHIVETCGQCHAEIAEEYSRSVHGMALAKGVKEAPGCTDCHGEHNILSPRDPRSPVAPLNVSGQVCSPCHSSVRLSEKYGITANRFQTFSDSYHGLAIRAGSAEVANCASCHGVHNIRPSSDPASMVHRANLAATCGKCHPGANERFAIGSVHVAMSAQEEPILYWIATLYIILIITVIGGMFIHNVLDFIKKSRRTLMIRRGLLMEESIGHSLYLRMTLNERLQHGALMVSFFLLVITGFMLRYPDAWWVIAIRSLSDQIFNLRSLVHRIAGIVLIASSLYHVCYIMFTQRGRELFRDLKLKIQDVRDALAVLRYNFGFSKIKPRFGRFSYIEKSEYWSLVWGTIVMSMTGVVMWFDNTFIGLFTKLGYDISRIIHFYEAWLATLAIIVWHIYYVIFNPDVYPMNLAWWKGTLTEAEMEEEHPLELEDIRRKEMEKAAINKGETLPNEKDSMNPVHQETASKKPIEP
ncbi:MAG: cytochrome b/b6 domain-containing protein [Ignavibacteriae bacterium]|nr:cytochrome b/b6 domain-containing protein [Ignavibacteriota bacterium]